MVITLVEGVGAQCHGVNFAFGSDKCFLLPYLRHIFHITIWIAAADFYNYMCCYLIQVSPWTTQFKISQKSLLIRVVILLLKHTLPLYCITSSVSPGFQ